MTTARAILLSALLIALAIAGGAWWSAAQGVGATRYQLANTGGGATVRLDRQTGDLIECRQGQCRALAKGEKLMRAPSDAWPGTEIPPPPSGFTIDK